MASIYVADIEHVAGIDASWEPEQGRCPQFKMNSTWSKETTKSIIDMIDLRKVLYKPSLGLAALKMLIVP